MEPVTPRIDAPFRYPPWYVEEKGLRPRRGEKWSQSYRAKTPRTASGGMWVHCIHFKATAFNRTNLFWSAPAQHTGWGSLPYLRQITITPSKYSTSSKRKTNHHPKASLPSPQIIRNRNAFLSLPCFNKDSPSSFCRLTQLQYHYRFTLQVRDTALNVCRASPRLLITCHSGDLNVRIQPAAVMLVGSRMMKTLDKSRRTRWIHIFGRLLVRDFHSTLTPWSDKWHLQNEQLSNLNCLTVAWSVLLSC